MKIMKIQLKTPRKFLFSIIIILVLAVSGFCYVISSKFKINEPEKMSFTTLSKMKRSDIQLFGDKNQYVLAPNNAYLAIGKKYAATNERKLAEISKRDKTKLQIKGEYWNLILYNLEKDGLPERKLDLFQIVRNFNKTSIPINLFGFYYYNGVSYYRVRIEDFSREDPTFKDVFLNIESEKIEEFPEGTKFSQDSDVYDIVDVTNLSEIIDPKGYMISSNKLAKFTLDGRVPETNINLYSIYPDLESKLIKKDWSLYIRSDKVTQEEVFETLLHWFAPKGQDILPVYGFNEDFSVSDPQIHNSQEAKAWLKEHSKLREEIMGEEEIGEK